MSLDSATRTRLLAAIEADDLVVVCGAGLSCASPSSLPLAAELARICYDRWRLIYSLPPHLQSDLDKLAAYFFGRGEFEDIFIKKVVPWDDLVGPPNEGHAALADLLISRGTHAVLSANFDPLIETWAGTHRVALQGALNGQEATNFTQNSNPLVKFHGCSLRARSDTLWTTDQLAASDVQQRLDSLAGWINLHLPGKQLLFVGFWTDWKYLNDALARALTINNAASVTVVDPKPAADLQSAAPTLWGILRGLSGTFVHIQASGADALADLRKEYSELWAQRLFDLGEPILAATGAVLAGPNPFGGLSNDDLYNLRRDAEGVPYSKAGSLKAPDPSAAQAAYAHLRLHTLGATRTGAWLEYGGSAIRVVNGGGKSLTDVQGRYIDPPSLPQPDYVICAGSKRWGAPSKIIPSGHGPAHTVHPAPGGTAEWLTLEEAEARLGL